MAHTIDNDSAEGEAFTAPRTARVYAVSVLVRSRDSGFGVEVNLNKAEPLGAPSAAIVNCTTSGA